MPTDSPPQENKGQSSSSSSWRTARACVKTLQAPPTAQGGRRVRLTPAPKPQGDGSIDFQAPSDESKGKKDHIIRNMCSKIWEQINKADDVHSMRGTWRMFMNDCMWARLFLGWRMSKIQDNRDEPCNYLKNISKIIEAARNQTWTPQKILP